MKEQNQLKACILERVQFNYNQGVNIVTEVMCEKDGLIKVTVLHEGKSGQKLKKKVEAENMEMECYFLTAIQVNS